MDNNKEQKLWLVEQRKLNILDVLKQEGGPFISEEEVDEYFKCDIPNDKKAKRMRNVVTYARDTLSISLVQAPFSKSATLL